MSGAVVEQRRPVYSCGSHQGFVVNHLWLVRFFRGDPPVCVCVFVVWGYEGRRGVKSS